MSVTTPEMSENQPSNDNPLTGNTPLPRFDAIEPSHAVPALRSLLNDAGSALEKIYEGPVSWDEVALAEERILCAISNVWAPVSHLHSVADSEEWREAYGEAVMLLTDFHTALDQNPKRAKAWQALADSDEFASLSAPQQQVVNHTLRDFRLSGAYLEDVSQQRFAEIRRRLTELGTAFQQNVQDATDGWSQHFTDATALAGLPENELKQAAARAGEEGGYTINLEYPSYHAVMTYADDGELRETVYRAYATRASDQGPHAGQWDNSPLILEMLTLRRELAQLLEFDSYADYSLETKMAPTVDATLAFLRSLAEKALPHARRDMRELNEFAASQGAATPLKAWDLAYWSEKLREERFAVSDEELRPYLSLDGCLKGMLDVTNQLFGIEFRANADAPVWHPDVRYYDVVDAEGSKLAGFYIDVYARKGKRGGAWMGSCRDRYRWPSHSQLPVAFLNCNFPAPTPEQPSLLNHRDLTTLFHEFGHSLHHMLTRIPYPAVGGISGVEWDAVEQPSQFLENWCWEREALDGFARHVSTGESMPSDLLEKLLAARRFQSGMFLVRQLEFALTDLRLHQEFDPDDHGQVARIVSEVRAEVAVVPYPRGNRFLNSFGHLFAGGYAAGYYSYLWAEQLAADAFGRFQEEGIFNAETGEAFRREVLETGGSRPAMDSFVAFRGRQPSIEPLLASYGL